MMADPQIDQMSRQLCSIVDELVASRCSLTNRFSTSATTSFPIRGIIIQGCAGAVKMS
jgi:hypothetical protein